MSTFLVDPALSKLAAQSGLLECWQDVHGRDRHVQPVVLRALLEALGSPCGSPSQIRESLDRLEQESAVERNAMILTDSGTAALFNYRGSSSYRVTLEHGECYGGTATQAGPGSVRIAAIDIPGYHTLEIGGVRRPLVVAPPRCPSMVDITGREHPRLWGVTAQVYGLRRFQHAASAQADVCLTEAGDYSALAQFARAAGCAGADAVTISPVHAMFSADPSRYSPYAPSSRLFLNASYVDPAIVLGADAVNAAMAELTTHAPTPQGDTLIDWPEVARSRMQLFLRLFENFDTQAPGHLVRAFRAFRQRAGEALEDHARYEAFHAHFAPMLGATSGWQQWPAELHDPRAAAVRRFAERLAKNVSFHAFLQWLADEGMRRAQDDAVQAGMAVGLITDLAIGTDARGSHAWSRQCDMLDQVSVGAAPDLHQARGQDWGLTAFSPRALRDKAFVPFIETLRAALAHAGGVRIDHILGLARMWLIPQGAAASEGVYVRYPLDDMLRILALEAWRHRALVIGENLGTIPAGFNERIYDKGIFGTSVLWFEREPPVPGDKATFTSSRAWSPHAVATTTTHDLPTIMGWWSGLDLQWRRQLDQITDDELTMLRLIRERDKDALCQALKEAGQGELDPLTASSQAVREAILSFVACAPTPLALIPIEDLLGQIEQSNLPGTYRPGPGAHPNWLRRQPQAASALFQTDGVSDCIAAVLHAREIS